MNTKTTLETLLAKHTQEAELYEKLPDNKVRCFACGHRCLILNNLPGICKVRFNRDGTLFAPANYTAALHCDPIEKKPFFHVMPGASALSFGMLGCDLHCGYCQNWVTSQTLRDPEAKASIREMSAQQIVNLTLRYGAKVVSSTYNEPLITSEWAVEVFREAKKHNLKTAYVSNGNATPEVLDYLKPWLDCYKVDLKSFQDRNYRKLGGRLQPILDTIRQLHEKKFWIEVVTLIVPGFNDSAEELNDIARFLAEVSPDIPWHVTAFHSDYKMTDREYTPARTLLQAAEMGKSAGLRYVYAGNLPSRVGNWENTYCPNCKALLVERAGFRVLQNHLTQGACPHCHTCIAGIWS
jgi:pyruvate formate lyase activating enzyme